MSYSEEQDFVEKEAVVGAMRQCLGSHIDELPDALALEVGGSGGILAALMSAHVQHVISTDIDDVVTKYDGQFPYLLKQKFLRNGRSFDIAKVEFLWADAQFLPFRENLFNFVFSLNAFEHIPDPLMALADVIRVTTPNGLIYLNFDPVWTADSGSHFLHRIGAPWQHLISSDMEIALMMEANGASPDEIESYKHHMNRLPASHYRDNFPAVIERCGASILHYSSYSGCVDAAYLSHPNLDMAARKLNCDKSDLLIRNFEYLIQKRPI